VSPTPVVVLRRGCGPSRSANSATASSDRCALLRDKVRDQGEGRSAAGTGEAEAGSTSGARSRDTVGAHRSGACRAGKVAKMTIMVACRETPRTIRPFVSIGSFQRPTTQ
jgi:hypothetical protein